MRQSNRKIGCVGYGCAGFFVIFILGIVALIMIGYRLFNVAFNQIVSDQRMHQELVGNTLNQEKNEYILLENVSNDIALFADHNMSGSIVLDAQTLDVLLRHVATGSVSLGMTIEDSIATTRATLDLSVF